MIQDILLQLLAQSKAQVTKAASKLNEENRFFRMSDDSATAIFLLHHIGEALHALGKMLLGADTLVEPNTLFVADTGQVTNIAQTQAMIASGFELIATAIADLGDSAEVWAAVSETIFGKINKVQAVGYMLHHNNYHLGQAALAMKKGKPSRICQMWAVNLNELMLLLSSSRLNEDITNGIEELEDDTMSDMLASLNEYFEDRPYMKSLFVLAGVIEGGMDLAEFEQTVDEAIEDSLEAYIQLMPNNILLLRLPKATYHGTWHLTDKQFSGRILGLVRRNELDMLDVEAGWELDESGEVLEKEILPNVVISTPLSFADEPTESAPLDFEVEILELNDVFMRLSFATQHEPQQIQLNNINALGIEGLSETLLHK
jgi:hypothetical protein